MVNRQWTLLFLIVCWMSSFIVQSCFITNCPNGGKRSGVYRALKKRSMTQECMRCGPNGEGRCFGTSICCGDRIGCFIGTSETNICSEEAKIPKLCKNKASQCNSVKNGQCVLENYCCNAYGQCNPDGSCHSKPSPMAGFDSEFLKELLQKEFPKLNEH